MLLIFLLGTGNPNTDKSNAPTTNKVTRWELRLQIIQQEHGNSATTMRPSLKARNRASQGKTDTRNREYEHQ